MRRWVAQAQTDAGERVGLTTEEQKEFAELMRQNMHLREEKEILRRASDSMPTARICQLPARLAPSDLFTGCSWC